MTIHTRLTERLKLRHPIILAPMHVAATGTLAAAVSGAGGLGLIGGGYQGEEWLEAQFDAAGNLSVGIGFITWWLEKSPELLDRALERQPAAILLSFGDPRRFAPNVVARGIPLICQIQSLDGARQAVEAGATIIVAQGTEAGGHGAARTMSSLVPEVVDLVSRISPDTLVCAAGGIADGRGLAAALVLGADGVLMGTRFWATTEANVPHALQAAALAANGDMTIRTSLPDIVRRYEWPKPFNIRTLKNGFVERWLGREEQLKSVADEELPKFQRAWAAGDAENGAVVVSESVGLIHEIAPVETVMNQIVRQAEGALSAANGCRT